MLKPGGSFIGIWNLEDGRQPWVSKLRNLYEVHEAGESRCAALTCPQVRADTICACRNAAIQVRFTLGARRPLSFARAAPLTPNLLSSQARSLEVHL